MQKYIPRKILREIKAEFRDWALLLRQFRFPLLAFIFIMSGCGTLFLALSKLNNGSVNSWAEAVYTVLTLAFLQSSGDFPDIWYLQIFYFVMPVLGISVLAQGLADFGVLLFNRRARGKEWEMAVASTFNHHIILVGLGHLGYRVTKILNEMEQDVVVIDLKTEEDLLSNVRGMGIPVINDNAMRESILEGAGIRRARSIILCTQDDNVNLQIALKARTLNEKIHVIIRIFDDDFAHSIKNQFGFNALSATGMAAPIFASSAANIDITSPISIEGQPNSLARLQITKHSKLANRTIDQVENAHHVSIILLTHEGEKFYHPNGDLIIHPGDTIAVLANPIQIAALANQNLEN